MIAVVAALVAVGGLTTGHLGIPVSGGVTVIGIVIGSGVARGKQLFEPSPFHSPKLIGPPEGVAES